ncbi:hypothetical protein ACQ86B_12550 [Mycolicibacterium aichiense]
MSSTADVGPRDEGNLMIPFICPACGQLDIDSPDCASCASAHDAA